LNDKRRDTPHSDDSMATAATTQVPSGSETLNIRLPKEVVSLLDALIDRKLFANRSEAIREFCRDYLKEGEHLNPAARAAAAAAAGAQGNVRPEVR
jgi:Arc/MetJ-type ribon-helix-helix transcriptional regulator